jgi:SAM-dependent methyltransferase
MSSTKPEPIAGGFRFKYKDGVDTYYSENGNKYSNPHHLDIADALKICVDNIKLEHDKPILDFCAGSGEVSLILKKYIKNKIIGSDPYTHELYKKNTSNDTYQWSFDDILNCAPDDFNIQFSVIICSYALHLCDKSKLSLVAQYLSRISPYLCIISPHKNPVLTEQMNWKLLYTDKCNKARLFIYTRINFINKL